MSIEPDVLGVLVHAERFGPVTAEDRKRILDEAEDLKIRAGIWQLAENNEIVAQVREDGKVTWRPTPDGQETSPKDSTPSE